MYSRRKIIAGKNENRSTSSQHHDDAKYPRAKIVQKELPGRGDKIPVKASLSKPGFLPKSSSKFRPFPRFCQNTKFPVAASGRSCCPALIHAIMWSGTENAKKIFAFGSRERQPARGRNGKRGWQNVALNARQVQKNRNYVSESSTQRYKLGTVGGKNLVVVDNMLL